MKNGLLLPILRTFIVRAVTALGAFFLIVILGKIFGPTGVGAFALVQSIYIGAGILARGGTDSALMRFVGEDQNSCYIKDYLFWSVKRTSLMSLGIAIVIYCFSGLLGSLFNEPALVGMLPYIAFAIIPFNVSFVLAGFMKGVSKPASACLLENGGISLISALLMYFVSKFTVMTLGQAALIITFSSWVILVFGLYKTYYWFSKLTKNFNVVKVSKSVFMSTSYSFLFIGIASLLQTVVSVLIVGWLLSSSELGLFKSAERVAFLISFVTIVLNSILPPYYAKYYRDGNLKLLKNLSVKSVWLSFMLASPIFFTILCFPEYVLNFIDEDFVEASDFLRILAIAQFINVVTGSASLLLNMTGNEKVMRNISITTNTLGLILIYFMTSIYGALGAALSVGFLLIFQNVVSVLFVWLKLKIILLPIPVLK